MRFYSAYVNIGGDRNHVLHKVNLTAAEIQVLQAIHGQQDVYNITAEPTSGRDNTPHETIREHLVKNYGRTTIGPDEDRHLVLPRVFPGFPNVKLPADVDAAGIDPALIADETPSRTRKAKATKAAATADDTSFAE